MEEKPSGVFASVGNLLTIGIQLALTVFVFFLIGRVLDNYFATSPWLMVAGLLIGIVGGIMKFIRVASEEARKQDAEYTKHHAKKN